MTPEQREAERQLFEKVAPSCGFPCPKPVAGVAYTFNPTPFAYASTNDGLQLWMKRAEIANAREAELQAEIERLRLEIEGHKVAGSILSGLTAALSEQPRVESEGG